MRCHVAVLSVAAAVVGCSTAPDDELTTREQIIKDLKLEITAPADRTLMAGTKPAIGLKVVNTSRTTLHHVVMPGDGSELGWREPYVYFTATYDSGDGKSVDLPNEAYGRC